MAGKHVNSGSTLKCTQGLAPSTLMVAVPMVAASTMPAANIMDHKPVVNIMPFGVCMSIANPTVAAATSAALGVLTPMPCIPATSSPWAPGAPTVLIANQPAVDNTCKLMCNWAGVIQVVSPGQTTHMIP
jgi:hypothetical protein